MATSASQQPIRDALTRALEYRSLGPQKKGHTEAERWFSGREETPDHPFLGKLALDRYAHWVVAYFWGERSEFRADDIEAVQNFLEHQSMLPIQGAVFQFRKKSHEQGNLTKLERWWGSVPETPITVTEGSAKFLIRLVSTEGPPLHHPGLFLDHEPLRRELGERCRGLRVLNLFSYTGSISIAAGLGGASQVVSVDLSRHFTEWARENWKANGLPESSGDFIYGDVFEWLPRLKKKGKSFDLIILDPPSFSRSEKRTFSTRSDLAELHTLAFSLFDKEAPVVQCFSSINSENVSKDEWNKAVARASEASLADRMLRHQHGISLPRGFPVSRSESPPLKGGWIQFVRSN